MGPQQDQSHDARVEAIDLTVSSPEPEARPQHAVHGYASHQKSTTTRREELESARRSTHSSYHHAQRHGSTRNGNIPQQQPRRVNPQHLKQIIDSSSSRALRDVVLQLCKTSPALSGALVRGLAPQSPWAQALIHGQRVKAQTQSSHAVKTEVRSKEEDAYERMKRRLGSGATSQSSGSQMRRTPPRTVHNNRDNLRLPPSSQKPSAVKRERQPSPTDSDDSTNIVDFPALERDAWSRQPGCNAATPSSHRSPAVALQSTGELAFRQHMTHDDAPDRKHKLCSQCGELYDGRFSTCHFHTGSETSTGPGGIPRFTCCGRSVDEPPCQVGRHTSERTGTFTHTKRPSPSPQSGLQWTKKPRMM